MHLYRLTMSILKACLLVLIFVSCTAAPALAQECPQTNPKGPTVASEVRMLVGKLIFHDDIRQWFELKLDQPQCGQTSVQLVRVEVTGLRWRFSEAVESGQRALLIFPLLDTISLDTYQSVDQIEPVGACARQSPFPDYSKAKPNKLIRAYTVSICRSTIGPEIIRSSFVCRVRAGLCGHGRLMQVIH